MNRKALSTLVSVVMMIVISIILGMSFGTIVVSSLKTSLSPDVATCTQLNINPPVKIKSACYQGNEIKVILERQFSDLPIDSIEFIATGQGQNAQWLCSSSCSQCQILNEGETKTYYLTAESLSESPRLVIQADGCAIDASQIKTC